MTSQSRQKSKIWSRKHGDKLRLDFHYGQEQAWRSDARFVFILAGTQSGKTSFLPWWLWREIQRNGAGDYLATTATYDLFKLKFLPEVREVFESVLGIARYWAGERVLEIADPESRRFMAKRSDDPMWARIILRSAQAGSGLESATAKAAILDECGQDHYTLETWEAIQRRLSLHVGRVCGGTTLYNLGWLKSEVYDAWADGDPDFDVVQFPSWYNPLFDYGEFRRAKAKLPAWRFSMFYEGQFARPAGLIYQAFDDSMLVEPFAIPAHWLRGIGIDFGGANVAIVWAALDPSTRIWYVYRDWLGGNSTTREYVDIAYDGLVGSERGFAVGGSPSESQQRRDWSAAGLPVLAPPFASVEAGIDRVVGVVKTNRLRVFRSCRGTRDEIGSYRRKLDTAGEPTDEIVDKRTYHRLDAIRALLSRAEEPDRGEPVLYDDTIRVSVGY